MTGTQKLFALLTVLILAFGFLPLLAQPLPYEGLDWLSYESTMYYTDGYEPDDTRFLAQECAVGGPIQIRNFYPSGDQDWVWFYTQAETSYAVETQAKPLGSLADTALELYDQNGELIASDDDGGTMTDARLKFQAAYTGVHFAKVIEWANRYGDPYWYHLRVVELHHHYLPIIVRGGS